MADPLRPCGAGAPDATGGAFVAVGMGGKIRVQQTMVVMFGSKTCLFFLGVPNFDEQLMRLLKFHEIEV